MEGATSLKASTLEAPELAACFSSTSNLKLPFAPSLYGHIATYVISCRPCKIHVKLQLLKLNVENVSTIKQHTLTCFGPRTFQAEILNASVKVIQETGLLKCLIKFWSYCSEALEHLHSDSTIALPARELITAA
ncbi:hypothetical protein V6N13_121901 [Hibiscus sabdariffa]